MRLYQCLLTKSACYQAGKHITPHGIMVHSTGENNPNLRRYVQPDDGRLGRNTGGNDWNRGGVGACVHAFIDRLQMALWRRTRPCLGRRGCGMLVPGRSGKSANNTHISFEICEDGMADGVYFDAVYREAVELCTYLCKTYHLRETDIICHVEGYSRALPATTPTCCTGSCDTTRPWTGSARTSRSY